MSYPLNPLDDFRSYSYHNILLVSNTTEGLRPFLSSRDSTDKDALSAITSTPHGEKVNFGDSSSGTYLVIDSRRTSDFSIREFNYSTFPGIGNASQTHVIVGLLNMIIVDPDGIIFINYLKYLIDEKLKSNLFGIHFLLKTIFVGHRSDGSTETVSTSSIPLMMFNLEFDVSYKEGVYTIQWVPMMHNIGTMIKDFTRIKDVKTISCEDGKLGTAIVNFENRLNETYRDWYKFNNIEQKAAGDAQEIKLNKKTGRLIQVMITIPKRWEEKFKVASNFSVDIERNFTKELQKRKELQEQETQEQKDAYKKELDELEQKSGGRETRSEIEKRLNRQTVSVSPTLNVYDVLSEILKLCPEVNAMANKEAIKENAITLFKTISSVTSNEEVILVHFDILEYTVPNITIDEKESNNNWYVEMPNGERIPKNSITYDYIFTGKNTDITEFSLKMQMAQQLFLNTSKVGSSSHRIVVDQKKQQNNPVTLNKTNVTFLRENDPVTFPIETIDTKKNFSYMSEKNDVDRQLKYQSDRNDWLQAVSKLHFMSSLTTKVTIRGNPNLMNKFIIDIIPKHITVENLKINTAVNREDFIKNSIFGNESTWTSQKTEYRKELDTFFEDNINKELKGQVQEDTEINGPKAFTYPLFVKINVFALNNLNYGSTATKLDSSDNRDYTQFWFDGWYRVFQIDNKFADGLFTQEMQLNAFELYGPEITTSTGGAETTEATANKETSTVQKPGLPLTDKERLIRESPEFKRGLVDANGNRTTKSAATSSNYVDTFNKEALIKNSSEFKKGFVDAQGNRTNIPVSPITLPSKPTVTESPVSNATYVPKGVTVDRINKARAWRNEKPLATNETFNVNKKWSFPA